MEVASYVFFKGRGIINFSSSKRMKEVNAATTLLEKWPQKNSGFERDQRTHDNKGPNPDTNPLVWL